MIDKRTVIFAVVAMVALASFYAYGKNTQQQENVQELDMTCGFTSDFAAFLKKSNWRTTKTTHSGTSSATTSSAQPMEARAAVPRNW